MNNMQKDANSGGVLNTDREAFNKYKLEKQFHKKVDRMSKDMEDIQECLSKICERIKSLEGQN